MARYQIWDGESDIITPSGAVFTAKEWRERYPWLKAEGSRMIITAGPINGGCAEYFDGFVALRKQQGAAITDSMTDEEILAAIEAFEDAQNEHKEGISNEKLTAESLASIAASLEYQNMMTLPDEEAAQ